MLALLGDLHPGQPVKVFYNPSDPDFHLTLYSTNGSGGILQTRL
jgi:hypothetical protein